MKLLFKHPNICFTLNWFKKLAYIKKKSLFFAVKVLHVKLFHITFALIRSCFILFIHSTNWRHIFSVGFILPFVSPYTKYTTLMNKAMPYNYPGELWCSSTAICLILEYPLLNCPLIFLIAVPVRDDGNMPDIPAHPSDPQGNKLDWYKNL